MWKSSQKNNCPSETIFNEKNIIFHDLFEECKHSSPGARLSYSLRNRLEKYPIEIRREIVNKVKLGCTPLFIACKKGQDEIVEYLLTVCNADIEQRGLYEVPEDRSTHIVTPLWCAAVSGKLTIVAILLKHNADINAVSDTGSTPVRSACFMTHYDIVKLLIEHGANINLPNYNGGTCLINSVQSVQLCEFLLKNGANVNAKDIQNKTALHYAIQEHRLETTKLLLKYGADYQIKSRYGDDALQMACLKGAQHIFEYLIKTIDYSKEKLINSYELLGTTFLDEHNDAVLALYYWREALFLRHKYNLLPKQTIDKQQQQQILLLKQKEFESFDQLEMISTDLDLMRIQSLLIIERILGKYHKDTIFRLMYRGAAYADLFKYQQCIDLWLKVLKIRIEKDCILYTDTCFTVQAIVRQMIEFNQKSPLNYDDNNDNREEDCQQRFQDVVTTFKLITTDILDIRQLLDIRPIYKRQAEFFDKILKCITHLIYLMIDISMKTNERKQIELSTQLLIDLIKLDLRSCINGDSLLHLCISKSNTIRSSYFIDEDPIVIFPTANVIKCLLNCGADVNCRNYDGCTPLHIATNSDVCSVWLINLLLDYGGHLDQPNTKGITPLQRIIEFNSTTTTINTNNNRNNNINNIINVNILKHITLKCLSAKIIINHRIQYENQIPKTLERFVLLHKP